LGTRNLTANSGFAPGLVAAHTNVGKRRGYVHARRPAGGAVGVYRSRNHPRSGTTNRTAGKLHQHSSWKQSWSDHTWNEVDGAIACAGNSGRSTLQPLGAAARHSPGRSTVDRGQRANWSSEGSVLPANQPDRERRISEFSAYKPVHGSSRVVEFWRLSGAAHFHRGRIRSNVKFTE